MKIFIAFILFALSGMIFGGMLDYYNIETSMATIIFHISIIVTYGIGIELLNLD